MGIEKLTSACSKYIKNNSFWTVLRWLAVLPVPLFCIFIIHLIIHSPLFVFSSPDQSGERLLFSSIPIQTIENLSAAFYAPFALLSIGAAIAPKFKLQTTQILGCLWAIIFILGIAQFLLAFSSSVWEWITFGATAALGVFGAFLGFSEAKEQHNEFINLMPKE